VGEVREAPERLRQAVLAARRRRASSRVEALIEAERALDEALALAVRDLRREGMSRAAIGELFGVQRHSAHERWRHPRISKEDL
jgi:hypothetical protein